MPIRTHGLRIAALGLLAASAAWLAGCGQDETTQAATAMLPTTGTQAPPSPDGIELASPRAAAVHEPSSPMAWGGPRKDGDATLSDRVVRYVIKATLDPQTHEIEGSEQLTWRNRSAQPIKAVYLHLYLNAFESSNSTYISEQRNLGFGFRSGAETKAGDWGHIALGQVRQGEAKVPVWFLHPDGGPATDHTVVRLDLPEAVAPGASTTLDIPFHDQLPRVVSRTGYFGSFHLVGQWFPKMAVLELPGERGATTVRWNAHEFHPFSEFYADYGSYDVRISAPKEYTVGATGEEVDTDASKPGMLTHHYVQDDVHDFAWTADKRTAKPLEGEYRGDGSPVVKVKVLFPPEYEASAAPVLKATLDSLAYFSRTLGPYPYKTVTAVIPPFNAEEAGGMEYPTFFTAEGYADAQPGTMNATSLEFVTIHEFGHGYFYGILGSNEFEEPMLDEGLNQYWDMRMMREAHEDWHMVTPLMKWLGMDVSISGFGVDRIAAMRHEPSDPTGANSWDRLSTQGYASVYMRTSTTMHDLEEALGKPVLEKAFKLYYQRWKFRHPDVADLRDALIEASGKPELVNAAFEQQAYHVRPVDDRIDTLTSVEELPQAGTTEQAGKWVEVKQDDIDRQVERAREQWDKAHPDAKPGTGPYPFRTTLTVRRRGVAVDQEVVVTFADGSTETVHFKDNTPWQRWSWVKPVKAVSAQIDPHERNTLNAELLKSSRTLEADSTASRRWGADIAAILQTFISFLATL